MRYKIPSLKRFLMASTLVFVTGLILVVALVLASRHPATPPKPQPVVQTQPMAQAQPVATNLPPAPLATTPAATTPATSAGVSPNWPSFQERPFPVAYESPNFQWTLADGKDTNIIRELAHNELEYKRMVSENSTIYRRQLIYLKETPAAVFEQAELTGKPVRQLTLPGLDGQELPVVVTRTDLRDGGNQGQVYGQLPGESDSMVTVAFVGDREAFTVISPRDQIYLQAESHDPGQLVVKSINPNTYGVITK